MKNKYTILLAAAFFNAVGTSAYAADLNQPDVQFTSTADFYLAVRAGVSIFDDTSFDLNSAAAVPTGIENIYEDRSFTASTALGINFSDSLRGEIEIGITEHDIDAHTIVALPATLSGDDAFGRTEVITGLVNGYYDFDLGGITPFVGAGIGYAKVDFINHGVVIPAGGVAGLPAGPITALDDSSEGLAWQVSAGSSFAITDATDFEVSYRYQSIENVTLTAVDGTVSDVDLSSHNITGGFRFNF